MATRICIECEKEKEETLFTKSMTDSKTGKIYYRNICKECKNKKQREERRKHKGETSTKEITPKIKTNKLNQFTNDEVEELKELLQYKEDLINLLELKEERKNILQLENKDKTKIMVSLETSVKNELYKYAKENRYNYSDVITFAVFQYLKNKKTY